ncbi:YihY/virulence factor BrkB family protein [Leifsonia sp. YAF41]|uniref:YihY/virulence factor BrkB family protein n=1 Tax=Leifsonia sp. YAF41 TaxID=3233086 RepID=UPI003F95194B
MKAIIDWVNKVIAWVNGLRPVRVFTHFGVSGGGILAGGMSYQSLFAVFAAIWVGFSIAGLWLGDHPELLNELYALINQSIPNLIGPDGVIQPSTLDSATVLSWTGAIALVGLLFTVLGWMSTTARAVRTIFRMPHLTTFFLWIKLRELGLGLFFGILLVLSAVISLASTAALSSLFGLLGIPQDSFWFNAAARGVGLTIVLILDTLTLALLFRVLSELYIPFGRLIAGSLLGAGALGVIKILGSALLGGAGANPLLAAFAVIVGLLIWFNLVSTVILLAASWIAVGMSDAGLTPQQHSAADLAKEKQQREEEALRIAAEVELRHAREARDRAPWYRVWSSDRRLHAAEQRVARTSSRQRPTQ